jgi:hypothetical protein
MKAETLGVVVGALSTVTALAALYIAIRNERRARLVAATQMILTLSSGFHEIFPRLGELKVPAANDAERAARIQYWHHGYLEWFLTNRFAPKDFKMVWDQYFLATNLSGYAHPGLRDSLNKSAENAKEGLGLYAQDYIEAIRAAGDAAHIPRD